MSLLAEYLVDKGRALAAHLQRLASGEAGPTRLRAHVTAEGRSGVRRIRIRDHQVLSDSPRGIAGFDLGPSAAELQLGVLGSCLSQSVLILAAERGLAVDEVEVEVTATLDPRGGRSGFEQVPVAPYDFECTLHIASSASGDQVQALVDAVERHCPIFNLLREPQRVRTRLRHLPPGGLQLVEAHALIA